MPCNVKMTADHAWRLFFIIKGTYFFLCHTNTAYTFKYFVDQQSIANYPTYTRPLLPSISLLSNNSSRFAILTTILSAVAAPNEQATSFYSPGSSQRCLQSLSNRLIHTLCKNIAVLVPAILHPTVYYTAGQLCAYSFAVF